MSPARWFARWRRQKVASSAAPIRVCTVITVTRDEFIQEQPCHAVLTYIAPFDVAAEMPRFRKVAMRVERTFPHPMTFNADEKHLAEKSPLLGVNALLREPVVGLSARLHMGRN